MVHLVWDILQSRYWECFFFDDTGRRRKKKTTLSERAGLPSFWCRKQKEKKGKKKKVETWQRSRHSAQIWCWWSAYWFSDLSTWAPPVCVIISDQAAPPSGCYGDKWDSLTKAASFIRVNNKLKVLMSLPRLREMHLKFSNQQRRLLMVNKLEYIFF